MQVREERVRRGSLGERGKIKVLHSVLDTPSRGVYGVWLWGVVTGIRRLIVHVSWRAGTFDHGQLFGLSDCLPHGLHYAER
jgi:hypothetical protein